MDERSSPTSRVEASVSGPALGIGAVAQRLGIAVATLRSWERRYGIGADGHSPGGHRRYTSEDMARLEYMCRLAGEGTPPAEAAALALSGGRGSDADAPRPAARAGGGGTLPVGRGAARRSGQGLAKAAMRLDPAAVAGVLDDAFATGGVVDTWDELVVPVLFGMGRKWAESSAALGQGAHGSRYVEVEHLLTYGVSAALHRAVAQAASEVGEVAASARSRGVVLACTEGELHTLALEALAAALAERGLPVRMFGAGLPRAALVQAVRRTGPAAVVLWSQTAPTCDLQALAMLRDAPRTTVVPAGPGWRAGARDVPLPTPANLRDAVRMLAGEP
ncbi:MerR family transcriptional regulator [Yinghuangia seranimata]|uniref:MerR family transcriptional regulator n=1 Tax=Yinghuangia seranimata TaxID=408067 RepID=UPI00248B1E8F|nr:MerR family transcriptional regulator [Yinghuangia seranimata]MDI2125064.1 MerR family transcriptional regulator [Yinghuangia seranimata]